ncbi:hypothetical protein CX676_03315 [Paracoccus zhejiangensis]|uniref:PepSY domain-containing protein n=2 Tax=Paracoccus zhejiangensis TaxID=1077935 RepID=A0A2H5EVJ0_9RHOB|nr:hypothetical protein CX676_03315 [Paracoccus zhejiangensis]
MKALSLAVVLALPPAQLVAAPPDVAAQVSQQLRAQGYRQIEVRRTLLGKVVVTARGNGHEREIVIDPRNGALLRDLVREDNGGDHGVSIARVGNRGDDDEKDDDDKDDDKDDGDDSSGSGSGGDDGEDDDRSGSGSDDGDDGDSSGSGGGGDRDSDSDSDSDDGDDD